ncbi:hypothetical protein JRO89_XS10G0188300 [Xanthoceras sorbifolium]|uniref:2-carboxy-D-arabinitol-1-phosphatase n=1 Tax=Xanthoceras sorbifolium TaxID=99658 RepID=A0ABQ8HJE3_9ROSI|nr:hypothetical protein JRO89_XS10G0188300 [Xanthoceras sorbifolium]
MLSFSVTPSVVHRNRLFIRSSFTVRSSSSSLQEIEESKPTVGRDLSSELYGAAPFPVIRTAKRVVLVRHGQSTWNEEGRIQGSSDFSVLTKKGEAQAETSRQMLLDDSFNACFSRCVRKRESSFEVGLNKKEKIILLCINNKRRSQFYCIQLSYNSDNSGLLKHEGKAKFGAAFRQWQVDAANFNIDGHYPVRELWARARSCWNKILANESKSILVVAHNAVNQALVATAIGLGTEYFRILLQSNCGVSVLDFTPRTEGGSPHICLNRLNQTPNSPVAGGSSAGRKTSKRIILVCNGSTQVDSEASFSYSVDQPMNMLGIIQSQKTAELLLDLKLSSIVSSPENACVETARAISRVQEAADCLGADCIPRYICYKHRGGLFIIQTQQKKNIGQAGRSGLVQAKSDGTTTRRLSKSQPTWTSIVADNYHDRGLDEGEPLLLFKGSAIINSVLTFRCIILFTAFIVELHLHFQSFGIRDLTHGGKQKGILVVAVRVFHLLYTSDARVLVFYTYPRKLKESRERGNLK